MVKLWLELLIDIRRFDDVNRQVDAVCLPLTELVKDRLRAIVSQTPFQDEQVMYVPLATSSSPSASISVDRAGANAACLSRGTSRLSRPLFAPAPETLFLLLMLMLFLRLKLLLPPKLFLLIRLARRLGILVPIGLYSLMKLLLLQAAEKLKDSSFSLCSFLTGARYLARGIGSPGLYTFEGHRSRSLLESFVDDVRSEEFGEAFRSAFLIRSRKAMARVVMWCGRGRFRDGEVGGKMDNEQRATRVVTKRKFQCPRAGIVELGTPVYYECRKVRM